ncbi:hypothetical protein M9H77_31656 [Catharanthus roseus]|uniref:Uncharacterized protein n=1 Tax=Catharanthus roseus TaxID=4058 RepID=A0ACC0A1K6_CATRO|nr:hypothetical protein M9H77_31656 [Catharanthus roseus]
MVDLVVVILNLPQSLTAATETMALLELHSKAFGIHLGALSATGMSAVICLSRLHYSRVLFWLAVKKCLRPTLSTRKLLCTLPSVPQKKRSSCESSPIFTANVGQVGGVGGNIHFMCVLGLMEEQEVSGRMVNKH